MPEPLSKLFPGSKVTIDPDILHDYAELAQYPMRVIADWSHSRLPSSIRDAWHFLPRPGAE
jgi:hypothetical protein